MALGFGLLSFWIRKGFLLESYCFALETLPPCSDVQKKYLPKFYCFSLALASPLLLNSKAAPSGVVSPLLLESKRFA